MLTTHTLDYFEILEPDSFVSIDPKGTDYPGVIIRVDKINELALVRHTTGNQHWYHLSKLRARKPDLRDYIRQALQRGTI